MADQLAATLQKDVEELEQLLRNDASPEVFLPLAEAYIRRGFPQEAIRVCQKGLKNNEHPKGRLLLARAFFDASADFKAPKTALLKKALHEVDDLLNKEPNNWEAHSLRGDILVEQDDLQGAKDALKKAHQLNPHHPHARMLLKSLGEDIEIQDEYGPFYINTELGVPVPQTDSIFKTVRDASIFFLVIFSGVWLYAQNAIHEKKIRALVILARTQQATAAYSNLKKAIPVYKKVLETLDPVHPFALMHLTEVHYSIWDQHERTDAYYQGFRDYFTKLQASGSRDLLDQLAPYHALRALVAYDSARKKQLDGKFDEADKDLKNANDYINKWVPEVAIHPRLNWVHGLVAEGLRQDRLARANFKRAAEIGWNNPYFRYRYAYSYLRSRKFQDAHGQFKSASEQGQQNAGNVQGELADRSKQKNAYCWINPPTLLGNSAPRGLELTTLDLLQDAANAALEAVTVPKCSFHPALQTFYAAHNHYLMADIGDALAVFDAGVGMSAAFQMVRDTLKLAETVKKDGDLSPHNEAWLHYLEAKMYWHQNDLTKAQASIEKALKIANYEGYFFGLQAMILARQKKFDEAWTNFQKALGLEPYVLQIYYDGVLSMLEALDANGKPTKADKVEELLGKIKQNFGEQDAFFYLSGELSEKKGDVEKADELWGKALEKDYEHYEANLARGILRLKRAKKLRPTTEKKGKKEEKVYPLEKEDFPLVLGYIKLYDKKLREKFKKRNDDWKQLIEKWEKRLKDEAAKTPRNPGIEKKVKERIKEYQDGLKASEEDVATYEEFQKDLKAENMPKKKIINLQMANILEALDEDAGAFIEQAMQTRPGSAEPRFWVGSLWHSNQRWADAQGHFDVAISGYLRDLDYDNAKKTSKLLAETIIKGEKEESDGIERATNTFKQKAAMLIRQEVVKFQAEKAQFMAQGKVADAEKHKPKPETIETVVRTLKMYSEALAEFEGLKETAEQFKGDAETVEKEGLEKTWDKMQARAREEAANKEKDPKKGKKGKKGKKRKR